MMAAGLLTATASFAQTEVMVGVTQGKDYGIVYMLPKTQIELEIKAEKVNYTPGEFSKYADRYLRLDNVSTTPATYWELKSIHKTQIELEIKAEKVNYTPGEFSKYADRYLRLDNVSTTPATYWELKSIQVKSVGVPDNEATYFVKLKDKTVAPLMELTEDGIVKSINVPYSQTENN